MRTAHKWSSPVRHRITLLEHDNATSHTIQDDDYGYIYMNTWVGAGTGISRVYLPKVADNEGRMFRFKSDGTIAANKYYRLSIQSDEITNGVRIDGNNFLTQDRDYDGIAVLCFDGQWYVIQRKSK